MNVFLTGQIQVGKSTAIRRYLSTRPGRRLGGFVTVSRPLEEGTLGVYIQPPVFAEADCTPERLVGLRGGRRGGIPETFERAGVAILSASGPHDLLLMDELGRMELRAPTFCAAVLAALRAMSPCASSRLRVCAGSIRPALTLTASSSPPAVSRSWI